MSKEQKPSNPKDLIGTNKVPLGLVPDTTKVLLALGHLEGNLKYGLVNWREAGVKFSIYIDALERHIAKLKAGEWADPTTKVPHLGNALACLSIITDAVYSGKLIDDRPMTTTGHHYGTLPRQQSVAELIDGATEIVKHLRQLFGDSKPTDYFIDGPKKRE